MRRKRLMPRTKRKILRAADFYMECLHEKKFEKEKKKKEPISERKTYFFKSKL